MNDNISSFVFRYRRFFTIAILTITLAIKDYFGGTTTLQLLIIGLILALIGIVFRMYTASFLLGKHVTTEIEADFLCASGPFAHIRHPLYLGNLIVGIGMCIAFNEWYGYAVYILQFTGMYSILIPYEERFMQNKFGNAYTEYMAQIRRFLPRLKGYKGSKKITPDYKRGILSEIFHLLIIISALIIYYFLFLE